MKKITLAASMLLFGLYTIKAQYGDAYHKANQEEIRKATQQRQQAQSDQHFKNIAPSTTKSSNTTVLPTSSSNYSPYAAEHQAKMEAYDRKEKARSDAWEEKERKFTALSSNVPKNEENYRKLIALAEQAGFEYYDAMRMNGRYKPKSVELATLSSSDQAQYDNYLKLAEEYKVKKSLTQEVEYLEKALLLRDDPKIRDKVAYVLQNYLKDYKRAAYHYYMGSETTVTSRPDIASTYRSWGEVLLMDNNLPDAIKILTAAHDMRPQENVAFRLSYAYYLSKKYAEAYAQLMQRWPNIYMANQNKLLQNYFMIQKGDTAQANALYATNKAIYKDVKSSGDMKKDLAQMLFYETTRANQNNIDAFIFYYLDVAQELDPENMEIANTKYKYNVLMKRIPEGT